MPDFLNDILAHKKKYVEERRAFYDGLKDKLDKSDYARYRLFKKAVSKPGQMNLIAEVKKASPSQGLIREDFDPLKIAKIYAAGGAAAISVLTEEKYFLGKPDYARMISEQVELPVLIKDFIIDEGQLYEAHLNGASAVLLIVAALDDQTLQKLYTTAGELDLDVLVEVHDEEELKRALAIDAEIIGINNRNLHSFEVDLNTAPSLAAKVSSGTVIVAESGLAAHQDIEDLHKAGIHAVLIGETFMRSDDIVLKIREIMKGG